MQHRRAAALASALAVAALTVSACGTEGPGGSGPGGPGGPTAIGTLDEARAAWAESGASSGEYRIQLLRTCFCQPILLDATVRSGAVVDATATSPVEMGGTGGEVPDDQLVGMPSTVDALHELIATETPDAHAVTVAYDSQGVPLSVWIDPIENAVDDEYGFEVSFASGDVDVEPAADDGAWREADLPAGASWPVDMPWRSNAQAVLTTAGGTSTLHLGLWGSSSCPDVPRSITWLTGAGEAGPGTVQAIVGVDATQPADTACTADFGPTAYAVDVPDGLLEPSSDGSGGGIVSVLVEAVSGTTADPAYASYVVVAAPSA